MTHVTQIEENAKEIGRNSLNYVTFKMLQKGYTVSDMFGVYLGKDNLTTAVVMLQKCLEKAFSKENCSPLVPPSSFQPCGSCAMPTFTNSGAGKCPCAPLTSYRTTHQKGLNCIVYP